MSPRITAEIIFAVSPTGWAIMRSSECVGWATMRTRSVVTTGVKCWHIHENPSPTGILWSRWADIAAAAEICLRAAMHATHFKTFLVGGGHNLPQTLSRLSGSSSSFSQRGQEIPRRKPQQARSPSSPSYCQPLTNPPFLGWAARRVEEFTEWHIQCTLERIKSIK